MPPKPKAVTGVLLPRQIVVSLEVLACNGKGTGIMSGILATQPTASVTVARWLPPHNCEWVGPVVLSGQVKA